LGGRGVRRSALRKRQTSTKRVAYDDRIGDVLADIFENVLPAYAIVSALAFVAGTLLRRVKRRTKV
jgi:hypothetical protein